MNIEQGGCYLVDMNPPRKSKPGKVRPVIVIQASDTIAAGTPGITLVPVTSKLQKANMLRVRLKPSDTLRLEKDSDALLDQIHTVDRGLFIENLGQVNPEEFEKIRNGVLFHLGFGA